MARWIRKKSSFLMWVILPSFLLVVSVAGVQFLSKPATGGASSIECTGTDATPCNSLFPNPCWTFQCLNSLCEPLARNTTDPACQACGTCGNGVCDAPTENPNNCAADCTPPFPPSGCPPTALPNGCSGNSFDFCCPGTCTGNPSDTVFDIDCGCCGDSLTGSGEQCDPSGSACTVPGDGAGTCNAQCQCTTNCGNGTVDSGEQCDPQATPNGCATGLTCNPTTCQCEGGAVCGDGTLDPGEECEGATCNFTAPDGSVIPGVCQLCICVPECQTEGSGCGDDGQSLPSVCFPGTGGGTGGGASLIPAGIRAGVLAQWLAAFAVPGAAFIGMKVRRRFKK